MVAVTVTVGLMFYPLYAYLDRDAREYPDEIGYQ